MNEKRGSGRTWPMALFHEETTRLGFAKESRTVQV
jgi:hypothetical protein